MSLEPFKYSQAWQAMIQSIQDLPEFLALQEERDRAIEDYLSKMAVQIGIASSIPGPTGATGAAGATGSTGATGAGVPVGGTTGQGLTKINATDFNTQWSDVQPLDSDLTTIAGLTATTDSFLQSKAGAWAARTIAQIKADLRPDIPVICTSGTRPGSPSTGQRIYETDTLKELTWNGTAWVIMYQPLTTFTAVRRGGTTADTKGTGGNAQNDGRYSISGGVCFFTIIFGFGTAGAAANVGGTTFDAPLAFNAAVPAFATVGSGTGVQAGARFNFQVLRDAGNTGFQLFAPAPVTSAVPGAVTNNDQWFLQGSYPI